jgi:hypothetical protein
MTDLSTTVKTDLTNINVFLLSRYHLTDDADYSFHHLLNQSIMARLYEYHQTIHTEITTKKISVFDTSLSRQKDAHINVNC